MVNCEESVHFRFIHAASDFICTYTLYTFAVCSWNIQHSGCYFMRRGMYAFLDLCATLVERQSSLLQFKDQMCHLWWLDYVLPPYVRTSQADWICCSAYSCVVLLMMLHSMLACASNDPRRKRMRDNLLYYTLKPSVPSLMTWETSLCNIHICTITYYSVFCKLASDACLMVAPIYTVHA